jgi:hypothetical protein
LRALSKWSVDKWLNLNVCVALVDECIARKVLPEKNL